MVDDKGAFEFNTNTTAESLVVTTTVDENNGTSDPSQGTGTSLREAILFANGYGGTNTITFSATAFGAPRKTIILNGTQLPALTGTLSIIAPGAGVEISGGNVSRVLQVNAGANVTLILLTIRNGQPTAGAQGGGIFNQGALVLESCTLSANVGGDGGAVYSDSDLSTALSLRNCTLSGNTATVSGGALHNADGLVTIDSCTIAGNTAPAGKGSGVFSFGSSATRTEVRNSIVSANTNTDVDFAGGATNSFQSNGYNLIGDGNAVGDFNQTGDVTGNSNPGLGVLAENGGRTRTRALLPSSPARDTGNTTLTVDQRGIARPQPFPSGADDKGAFELPLTESLVVTTTADEDDSTSDPAYGAGTSLREAINRANTDNVTSAITFSATAFAAPRKTITLGNTLPIMVSNLTLSITAPAVGVEISGNNVVPVFTNTADTTMTGLTIRNGNTTYRGGAIQNLGALLLDSCSLINNSAAVGGAVSTQTPLTVRNCTFVGNAANNGGAIYSFSGAQTLIESSTIVGNTAPAGQGSGVASVGDSNTRTEVHNSIIAGNTNGDVDIVFGSTNSFQSDGYNLVGDGNATAEFNQPGDQLIGNATPGLKPLGDYGGRTLTLALLPDSPAANQGSTALSFDQRGVIRPQGAFDDKGAFELVILAISPATLPGGQVGQVYSTTTLFASGGTSPYAFSINAGYLPPGLTLTNAGQLSGTARSAGVYDFTVGATDSTAGSGERDYSITIAGVSARLAEAATVWYRAEGDSNSFSGTAATIVGNVTFAAGETGQAFSFAGDGGYVALPASAFPYPTSGTSRVPFSFETWFSTTASGVVLGQQNVAPFGNTTGTVPAIYVGLDGKVRVEMFWNGSLSQITSAGIVNDGAFHHVAAVYDGTNLIAYLDGVAIGTRPFTQTAYAGSYFYQLGTGLLGGRPSAPTGWFNFSGLIDEAAVYSHALTATEVQSLYAAGQKGKSTEPFFTSIDRNGANFTIGLAGWPSLHFQLQHSQLLSPSNFTNIGAPAFTDGNGDAVFTVAPPVPGATSGFFRVIEVP